jgi:type I restriction enzyme S subunit
MSKLTKYKFSDLYEMSSGISSSKEQAGHGSPFISFSTVFNNYFLPEELPDLMDTSLKEQEIFSVKKDDVFITRTSETVDALAMSCVAVKDYPKATFSGFVKRLRPKTTGIVYSKYIAFFLRSKYFRKVLDCNTIMTLRASFNEDMFSFLYLYLPDYEEQVRIGDLLYKMEMKIRTNNKINDNLEQQLMLLYDYWFIQFDFPDNNGNPYQISGGKMVWNDTLRRNIPENWKVQSVISNCLSSVIKPGVKIFNTKTYLATADVKGTSISTGTIVDYDGRESRANMQPSINSVWFAKMKNSIKHLYLNKEMQPIISSSILSTGFCGLQCNEISFEYIASYVSNAYFEIHKDMLAHGATQEAVNNDDLAGVHIIIPEDTVLCAYHETTQAIYAQISKNVCENQELVKLRDWLLPMLMNGQATIND